MGINTIYLRDKMLLSKITRWWIHNTAPVLLPTLVLVGNSAELSNMIIILGESGLFFLVVSNLTFVFFGSEQFVKTLECWKERSIIENA